MSGPRAIHPFNDESAAQLLAVVAVEAARGQLDRYANITDDPAPGSVEAADLLDAARDLLTEEAVP